MTFAYYTLARKEEADCRARFGEAYAEYADSVAFLVPGDRLFRKPGRLAVRVIRPRALRAVLAFLIWMGLGVGLSVGLVHWRLGRMDLPAYAQARVPVAPGRAVDLLLLSGFAHQIKGSHQVEDFGSYWDGVAGRIASSSRMKQALSAIEEPYDCLIAFPKSRTMWPGKERRLLEADFVVLAFDCRGAFDTNRVAGIRERCTAVWGLQIENVNTRPRREGPSGGGAVAGKVSPLLEVVSRTRERCRRREMDGLLNLYLSGVGSNMRRLYRILEP